MRKKATAGTVASALRVSGGARLRQRERGDGHHFLAPDAQRLTTGRQHLQPGRLLQELLDQRRRRDQLLDVVHHEEQVAGAEEREQPLVKRLAWQVRDSKLLDQRVADQGNIGQGLERYKRGAVGELARGGVRGRDGQGGLAHTTRPGQRHQPHVSLPQQPGSHLQLFHPVDERPARRGQRGGGRSLGRAGEALGQQQSQVVGDQATDLIGILVVAIGDHALGMDGVQKAGQPRLAPHCLLRVNQPGLARRQAVLVLQAGDLHAGSDPPIGLGIDANENVALRQVSAVQIPGRVRPGAELEQHGR